MSEVSDNLESSSSCLKSSLKLVQDASNGVSAVITDTRSNDLKRVINQLWEVENELRSAETTISRIRREELGLNN
jgi:hypothetical protein